MRCFLSFSLFFFSLSDEFRPAPDDWSPVSFSDGKVSFVIHRTEVRREQPTTNSSKLGRTDTEIAALVVGQSAANQNRRKMIGQVSTRSEMRVVFCARVFPSFELRMSFRSVKEPSVLDCFSLEPSHVNEKGPCHSTSMTNRHCHSVALSRSIEQVNGEKPSALRGKVLGPLPRPRNDRLHSGCHSLTCFNGKYQSISNGIEWISLKRLDFDRNILEISID